MKKRPKNILNFTDVENLIKKMSKGYYVEFDEYTPDRTEENEENDHTKKIEENDHAKKFLRKNPKKRK
ncbi:MAG: hypothetical protein Q8T03_01310 [Bacteroidota bacterium]|nr:hypothetical protein [Bacteroidota bacterium]